MNQNSVPSKINELAQRSQNVNNKLMQLNYAREQTQRELADAQNEAQQKFGTSDIENLRQIYQNAVRDENRLLNEFEKSVLQTEQLLNQVDQELAALSQEM